jgi:hypothetical protein
MPSSATVEMLDEGFGALHRLWQHLALLQLANCVSAKIKWHLGMGFTSNCVPRTDGKVREMPSSASGEMLDEDFDALIRV